MPELALGARELRRAVRADAFTQPSCPASEKAELAVGIEAAVAHPTAKDQVEAGNPISVKFWVGSIFASKQFADFLL